MNLLGQKSIWRLELEHIWSSAGSKQKEEKHHKHPGTLIHSVQSRAAAQSIKQQWSNNDGRNERYGNSHYYWRMFGMILILIMMISLTNESEGEACGDIRLSVEENWEGDRFGNWVRYSCTLDGCGIDKSCRNVGCKRFALKPKEMEILLRIEG